MLPTQQQPLYVLNQDQKRALIPKIIILIALSAIFYVGILLNISLLDMRASQENLAKTISLIVVIVIAIVGIGLAIWHARNKVYFYADHLVINKKSLSINSILNTQAKQDILDKIFKSESINLGNNFHLRHIPQQLQIPNYINQLIAYQKKQAAFTGS
ncbi:MAG: hypothetical protein CMH26_03215 [Micavibrio sp.]|nr:hypothetical protein [Micavibrio sp.]